MRKEVVTGDIVWVQDYHLMLVPLYLRDLLGRDPASMGEASQTVVAGMFDGLMMGGSTAASPLMKMPGSPLIRGRGSVATKGVNGSHGRALIPEVQIGFFLHTPFPSSEVFRFVFLSFPVDFS